MKPLFTIGKVILGICLLVPSYTAAKQQTIAIDDVMAQRLHKEKAGHNNAFLVSLYRPTYIIPFNYTTKPYQKVYVDTPQSQSLNQGEVKFQLSLKIPVWKNAFNDPNSILYVAYTQQSYWQAYNHSAFFRETNYEPEVFLAHHFNRPLLGDWKLSLLTVGASHQSNGKGGILERSWNRIYGEAILANSHWMFSVKPWFVVRDNSYRRYNENLARYLGYERMLFSYKYHDHVFSVEARNTVESHFSRGAIQASWSFPLTTHLRGYTEFFSGFGQNLIEYDHHTNSIGVGIALTDWI